MEQYWKRRTLITIGCMLSDLIFMGWSGARFMLPTLANYHALLWLSRSWTLYCVAAFSVLILSHLSGYDSFAEMLFLGASGMSALLLKRFLQESALMVFGFMFLALILHTLTVGMSVTWTGTFIAANLISIYSILKYQDVR